MKNSAPSVGKPSPQQIFIETVAHEMGVSPDVKYAQRSTSSPRPDEPDNDVTLEPMEGEEVVENTRVNTEALISVEKKTAKWNREYAVHNPEKLAARMAVYKSIEAGQLMRKPCEVCKTEQDVQAHHDSYAEQHQLDVRWLCRIHHKEYHRKNPC